MGLRTFIRRFKAATPLLPNAYLQAVRASKGLLAAGPTSLQTICTRVGYQDIAHFRELLRRHTDMTPAPYRNRFTTAESLKP